MRTKACFILCKLFAPSTSVLFGIHIPPIVDYLVSDNKELCQLAFDRGSLKKLAELVKSITPSDAPPGWDEDEPESISILREVRMY